jgi:hypothetical protein
VADVVSKGRSLATHFAFRHDCTSLTQIEPASTSAGPIQSELRLALYHRPSSLANRAPAKVATLSLRPPHGADRGAGARKPRAR